MESEEEARHVADLVCTAATKLPHHRRRETRAASSVSSGARDAGCCVGGAASEPAPEERTRLALDDPESAARQLEDTFVYAVEENELFMPAVEQLYAALQKAEVSVTVLEARLSQGHRRGGP